MKIYNHEQEKREKSSMDGKEKEKICPVVKSNGNGNYKQNHQMVVTERKEAEKKETKGTFNGASFHNLWLPRMMLSEAELFATHLF